MSWRFGSNAASHVDLPAAPDVQVQRTEIGGRSRSISGRLNVDRKAIKRTWVFALRSWLDQSVWQRIVDLWEASPGPYLLWNSLNPNELSESMAQGLSGWRTAAGGATNTGLYTFTLDAGTPAIQTAKTTNPPPADLFEIATDEVTFAMTLAGSGLFGGSLAVYGYPLNGVGNGTLMVQFAFNQSDVGRVAVTGSVDSATYPLYSIRITRSSGVFQVSDFGMFRQYAVAPKPSIVPVMIDSLEQTAHRKDGRSTLSLTVSEV